MIVATAGHVDHGKTLLVRALTGVDTDRLAEEKRRGMTIDLGFAYADFGGPEPTGFVDVPGHERFVRNMLAGLSRVDLALLVIAADDGPMPQTREHLAILALAGAGALAVVLTKIDRVDPTGLARARGQIAQLLAGTAWADAPVFPVDTPRQQGLAELREHIAALARDVGPAPAGGHFRMSIDRAFTVAGAGLVVTGTVLSGIASVGDLLRLSPEGGPVRVRGVHAQGRPAAQAREGQRCALNIAGAQRSADEVARGQWLLADELHAPSARLDVRLALDGEAARSPSRRGALQLHLGAAAIGATLAPLAAFEPGDDPGAPGTAMLAQLVLERPASALRGDRFVLRDPAGHRTLGGGEIIDPWAPARGRSRPGRIAWLRAMAATDASSALPGLLACSPAGIDAGAWRRAWNLDSAQAEAAADSLGARSLRVDGGQRLIAPDHWRAWRDAVLGALADEHAAHPERSGAPEAELLRAACARFRAGVDADADWPERARDLQAVARLAVTELAQAGELVRAGMRLRLPRHEARLPPADAALLERVMPLLREALLRPPIAGEVASALGITREEALGFLRRMAALGHVLPVAGNRFFAPEALPALADIARGLAATSDDGSFDAAAYRDASGIGRNLTIEVLEFLDRAGVTVFAGERRRLARPTGAV